MIVAKHVWETVEDPLTFKNYDPEKGWPLTLGPYVLNKVTTNEAIWVRNDDWWAAKIGLKNLPAPKKVIYSYAGTEEVRRLAETVAREVERRAPELATSRWWKEERGARVFVDFNQANRDRTIAGAYSPRPLAWAPVSTPLASKWPFLSAIHQGP